MRILTCFTFLLLLIAACRKDERITTDPSARLSFSDDTVVFDTVFTSAGSTTRRLRVYNPNKNALRISEIKLTGGNTSPYQININGKPANNLNDIELAAGDSLFIFIKVTINPDDRALPFLVSDEISFLSNTNLQKIQLRAYGQNARFIDTQVLHGNVSWDNRLPYVIYNSVNVAPDAILNIGQGSRIYFHKGARLIVDGTLNVQGEVNNAVTFAGDRLESIYSDEAGQWIGVHLTASSKDNLIRYAVLKNAIEGIRIDSPSVTKQPKLIISNSIIKNMQISGLSMYNSDIRGFNNLMYNCGSYLLYGTGGGRYDFSQNTLAGISYFFSRQNPAVFFSALRPPENKASAALSVNLSNNIIWGNLDKELLIEQGGNPNFNIQLKTNLIKTKDPAFNINGNILNIDPLFAGVYGQNFHLSAGSPALAKGSDLHGDDYFKVFLQTDFNGNERIFPSALGCYEK